MKMRLALIGVAFFALGLPASDAGAQSCIQNPLKTCEWRNANPRINRYQVPNGGDVVCNAYSGAPAPMQYDTYVYYNYKQYVTSCFQTCVWAQTNDPTAHSQLCN